MTEPTEQQVADRLQRARRAMADQQLDTGPGSVLDSVLLLPMALLTAEIQAETDAALSATQLQSIAAGDVQVSDAYLDNLMAGYGVTRRQALRSTGICRFYTNSQLPRTIPPSLQLTRLGRVYQPLQSVDVRPRSAGGVESAGRVFIRPAVGPNGESWSFDIPVIAQAPGPGPSLVAGDVLQQSAIAAVSAVRALTFTVGSLPETNQQLAARALDGIVPSSLSGRRATDRLMSELFPQASAMQSGVGSPVNFRRAAGLFAAQTSTSVDLWVKSGAPERRVIQLQAVVIDPGTRTAQLTVDVRQAAGAYTAEVLPFSAQALTGPVVSGEILLTSAVYTQQPFAGRLPYVPDPLDLQGSASASITLTFTDTREYAGGTPVVAFGSPGDPIADEYAAGLLVMPGVREIADAVYSGEVGNPGVDYLVRAALPIFVSATVSLTIPDGVSQPTADELAGVVGGAINRLPVSRRTLDIHTISGAVRAVYPEITVLSVGLSGAVLGADGQTLAIQAVNQQLTAPVVASRRLAPESTFFTARRADVGINIV